MCRTMAPRQALSPFGSVRGMTMLRSRQLLNEALINASDADVAPLLVDQRPRNKDEVNAHHSR
jgi:hypothetical protein